VNSNTSTRLSRLVLDLHCRTTFGGGRGNYSDDYHYSTLQICFAGLSSVGTHHTAGCGYSSFSFNFWLTLLVTAYKSIHGTSVLFEPRIGSTSLLPREWMATGQVGSGSQGPHTSFKFWFPRWSMGATNHLM
jgi:hypothetical protein